MSCAHSLGSIIRNGIYCAIALRWSYERRARAASPKFCSARTTCAPCEMQGSKHREHTTHMCRPHRVRTFTCAPTTRTATHTTLHAAHTTTYSSARSSHQQLQPEQAVFFHRISANHTFTVLKCTLCHHTFTILNQKPSTFTVPPPPMGPNWRRVDLETDTTTCRETCSY